MNFALPTDLTEEIADFDAFLSTALAPHIAEWYRAGSVPRDFYAAFGEAGWIGFRMEHDRLVKTSAFRESLVMAALARISPGVAITNLVVSDLGLIGLYLFGSPALQARYGPEGVAGRRLICLGNTENHAGSDVANIRTTAEKREGGWVLNGTKAYVTNGLISDMAVVTAVTDPDAPRNRRLSMFLVDLDAAGVSRKKLDKRVWIPSDLTRIKMQDLFVPADHLLGERGRGLQQVLSIFSHSRVPISALTLGTAEGAFDLALQHGAKRAVFGKPLLEFQAKAFETADLHARLEAARLMLCKACWRMDRGDDFRKAAAMAKYLAVGIARDVTTWSADLFGAASVMHTHPIHKFPLDAWGSALGEGTQDVQKLVIFRELMKQRGLDVTL